MPTSPERGAAFLAELILLVIDAVTWAGRGATRTLHRWLSATRASSQHGRNRTPPP